jgi:hypothetical protein
VLALLALKDSVPWSEAPRFITDIEDLTWYLEKRGCNETSLSLRSLLTGFCSSVPFLLQLLYGTNPNMTDAEFDKAAAAHGHDGKLLRENNRGWRAYSRRDAEGDFKGPVRPSSLLN